jgi:periplasmic protein TonB
MKVLLIFCLILSTQAFGQEKEVPEIVYKEVDENAEFPGGMKAFKLFITENLKYPESGLEIGAEGNCYLQFVVAKDGTIKDVKVRYGIADCPECDAEAVRLLKSTPKWEPAKVKGENVSSSFYLPITFRLP